MISPVQPSGFLTRVRCTLCGSDMLPRTTEKFTYRDGSPRRFWGCSRWPECDGLVGANADGTPYGTCGDKATREARQRAHQAFDPLWRNGWMERDTAYLLLALWLRRRGENLWADQTCH